MFTKGKGKWNNWFQVTDNSRAPYSLRETWVGRTILRLLCQWRQPFKYFVQKMENRTNWPFFAPQCSVNIFKVITRLKKWIHRSELLLLWRKLAVIKRAIKKQFNEEICDCLRKASSLNLAGGLWTLFSPRLQQYKKIILPLLGFCRDFSFRKSLLWVHTWNIIIHGKPEAKIVFLPISY